MRPSDAATWPQPFPIRPEPAGRSVVAADGVRYHVISLGDDHNGRATPAVFLHGGGPGCSSWTDFGPVAPLFAVDRPAHLVDLLQYGKSGKPTIVGPRWDWLATSLIALLDRMELDRVDLVCNSWGGTIAIALAALHPHRVRSMVITGSMPVFYGPLAPLPEGGRRGRNARDAYFGGDGPSIDKMRRLIGDLEWFDASLIPEETVRTRYEQSLDREEMSLAAHSDDLRGEWQDLEGHLRRIECPTLFCWGMYDAFLTPDYPLMLARMVPHGQLYVMDRASHHLQEERPWDYYVIVDAFLRQHDRAPAS
jgi:2-hydroxy-6-oxonona-2,4-dienedioate hydrolase